MVRTEVAKSEMEDYLFRIYGSKNYFKWELIDRKGFIDRYQSVLSEKGITLKISL